ncbi:MAG TPA: hypothetical protein ENH82_11075 [bacterium]|nr:hypothetical protein [bacterium]
MTKFGEVYISPPLDLTGREYVILGKQYTEAKERIRELEKELAEAVSWITYLYAATNYGFPPEELEAFLEKHKPNPPTQSPEGRKEGTTLSKQQLTDKVDRIIRDHYHNNQIGETLSETEGLIIKLRDEIVDFIVVNFVPNERIR